MGDGSGSSRDIGSIALPQKRHLIAADLMVSAQNGQVRVSPLSTSISETPGRWKSLICSISGTLGSTDATSARNFFDKAAFSPHAICWPDPIPPRRAIVPPTITREPSPLSKTVACISCPAYDFKDRPVLKEIVRPVSSALINV